MATSGPLSVHMPSQISFCPTSLNRSACYHLVFFITGNPGVISFYNTFLETLSQLLSSDVQLSPNSELYHVYGQSLAGFDDADNFDTASPPPRYPYGLEDQIERSLQALQDLRIRSGPRQGQSYDSIILIGHSVGSYILLEILRRLRQDCSSSLGNVPVNIKAGILLFPTVINIAQSPSGTILSTLSRMPGFARRANFVAKILLWPLPRSILRWLVGFVTGMPHESAEITTRFLTSRIGIWQALHMGKDEMENITEDKWDEKIWGVEYEDPESKVHNPKLIFYFGQNDHWVANHTRDALISARGRKEEDTPSSKPIMLIDESNISHGFCIRHSEIVAEKVHSWISNIMESS